jgi:hypothetical protein
MGIRGKALQFLYSERLLYVGIGNEVMAGSREVLFQAATDKLQTFLYGTKAS